MGLIVALDEDGTAQGDLFWDDGDSQGGYIVYLLFMDCLHDIDVVVVKLRSYIHQLGRSMDSLFLGCEHCMNNELANLSVWSNDKSTEQGKTACNRLTLKRLP